MAYLNKRIAVIVPAHNEAPSITKVITELVALRSPDTASQPLVDELIVCDNASSDGTDVYAEQAGATVVKEFRLGYGFACLRGIDALNRHDVKKPDYVVFVDGDHSVDVQQISRLLDELIKGADLVVGNRTAELQEYNALSPHQRFGNRLASGLIGLIWKQPVNDLGPFRAIRFSTLMRLDMQDQRFGWTVEMQVKAIQAGLSYREVPVSTLRRVGVSKISGTVRGTIGAAVGIFGKIFELYLREPKFLLAFGK